MRVALVHDYLNQWGGGERVLKVLMQMFPSAPVYTILYDKQRTHGHFSGKVLGKSFLNLPWVRTHHRLFIPVMPFAIRCMHLECWYDLIISDSAGFAKGIPHDKHTKHISYVHTPLRYAWETETYFNGNWRHKLFQKVFAPVFRFVRRMDFQFSKYPDLLLANSEFIAQKIKQYYGRDADVVYPPVDLKTFYYDPVYPDAPIGSGLRPPAAEPERRSYLAVGRFLHYKRFDLIIQAFNELDLPLKVVGAGRDEKKLKKMVKSPNITFLEYQSDDELRRLYNGAKALLFPQVEDFGLSAAEAQACGLPIIAFKQGGATEIVEESQTGIFFDEQSVIALERAVERFEDMTFDRAHIAKRAERFSQENFEKGISKAIAKIFA